jgi:hypothetical protein
VQQTEDHRAAISWKPSMRLRDSLEAVADISPEDSMTFAATSTPQSLQGTGTATPRKRRLPAEQVVWLVIGMAPFSETVRSMRS